VIRRIAFHRAEDHEPGELFFMLLGFLLLPANSEIRGLRMFAVLPRHRCAVEHPIRLLSALLNRVDGPIEEETQMRVDGVRHNRQGEINLIAALR